MFRSQDNHLYFSEKVKGNVLPVTAALYNLISKQGYQDIILDFSDATFLEPSYMVPLVTTVRSYCNGQIDFEIRLPTERTTANLLRNTNWAHLMAPEVFEKRDLHHQRHLSAVQYLDAEQHYAAVDRSLSVIMASVEGLDRSRLKALEWSLNEITDNVLNHAESPVGGILQVVTFGRRQLVEFYVCDAGIGIPRSLRQGRPQIDNDVQAVRAAIEEGVTRNSSTNQGNGLYGTFKCCEVSEGQFDVLSGNVRLHHEPGMLQVSKETIPFPGTFVRASINCSFDKLLERALIFKGRAHEPQHDYVDRLYQAAGNELEFNVSKELEAFGSREAGRLARTKIENLMDKGRVGITFDFDGIHLISSSFADEVFGRLFVELGPIRFGQLCRFKNVDSTVQTLIDRAISQRMKQ